MFEQCRICLASGLFVCLIDLNVQDSSSTRQEQAIRPLDSHRLRPPMYIHGGNMVVALEDFAREPAARNACFAYP